MTRPRPSVTRIDRGGDIHRVDVVGVDRGKPGIVLFGMPKCRARFCERLNAPPVADETKIEEAMIFEFRALGDVIRAATDDADRILRSVELQIDRPRMRHPLAAPGAVSREDLRQLGLRYLTAIEQYICYDRSIGTMQPAVLEIAVIDAGVVVARMVFRGEEIDAVHPIGRVFDVAVDVADLGDGEELAAVRPGIPLVGGDHDAGIVVDGSREIVHAPLRRQVMQIGIGRADTAADLQPVEQLLAAPARSVARQRGNPPTRERVGTMLRIGGEISSIWTDQERRGVVIIGLEPLMQDDAIACACAKMIVRELHVPCAIEPARPFRRGNGAHQQRAGVFVEHRAGILVPAPCTIVVEGDEIARDPTTRSG